MESIFAGMTGSKEEARQLALDFYGPIFLLYSLYDSAEEKNQITDLLVYSIQQAAKLECRALCFEGNIDFYGKSGFRPASKFEIRYHGIPDGEDASFFPVQGADSWLSKRYNRCVRTPVRLPGCS